ncbi:hypothetical protein TBLA_0B08320 [Henningerozyma blattae CBS 6284]|uniref:Sec20 C-terminal domain-containing protein n=1 Tax=Henningerozyma blattae (strain ATCC 34711 / CBS 6284 / DSM 70876 / NBRC 10599 / NRRL Y-10934 / UCD 77-7) TaxID=1071380 RepID=I2GZU5_HENB6|nr:hypothetical protein TBLA_0B08320 [Tetrapisispora blattae CBS 6284]CCH59647.1 hypothetical protein TBLA_0B08320 [Tetrapisispora blattae CBS 6284]
MSTFIQLQSKLLNQLKEYAKLPDDSENTKNLSNDIVGKIFDIESLIEYQVAFVSKKYSGLKLKIKHSEDCHVCDELEINTSKMNIFDNESQQQLMAELEEILEMIGWIYEFKKQWKQIVNDNEYRRQELKKKTRRETIETEVDKVTTSSSDEREVHSYAFPKTKTETSKAQLLKTTKKLTNSLMRGNQILETGILQSDLNLDELRSQTHSITIMNEKYQQFETIFKKTNQLVKSLERASQQEKRDVYLSLAFLIMCISWVLWRRIFKLPVKLALWMLFQFFKGILLTMGLVQKTAATCM